MLCRRVLCLVVLQLNVLNVAAFLGTSQYSLEATEENHENSVRNVYCFGVSSRLNSLNAEVNPICPLLALFGAHHILHVSR
jgi:hypothetical protein